MRFYKYARDFTSKREGADPQIVEFLKANPVERSIWYDSQLTLIFPEGTDTSPLDKMLSRKGISSIHIEREFAITEGLAANDLECNVGEQTKLLVQQYFEYIVPPSQRQRMDRLFNAISFNRAGGADRAA